MTLASLVLAFALPTGVVEAVRMDQVGLRPAVTVVTRGGSGAVAVRREGREVILTLEASLPQTLRPPLPVPPLEGLGVVSEAGGTSVRLSMAEHVPYQILRTETSVSVVLGPVEPTVSAPAGERPSVQELYPLIFALPPEAGDDTAGPLAPASPGDATRREDEEGLYIGFVRLRPSVLFNYIDAETALFDSPQPSRQRYFEIDPRLGLGLGMGIGTELAIFGGRLEIQYEPRFRPGVTLAALRQPTHTLNANLTLPVGSAVTLRGSHHYSRGLLETTEVDPGREYFFDLGRFTRNHTQVGARFDAGSRLDLDLSAGRDKVDIDDDAGFFDHQRESLSVAPGYALRPDLRLFLDFRAARVPPPERRPEAESSMREVSLGLSGQVTALIRGELKGGIEHRQSPRAGPGGTEFKGVTARLRLDKEFTPSSRLTLSGQRSTELSFFESNAFYVTTRVEAAQTFGLPFFFTFRGAVGQQWNRYRTVAVGLDEPRADDIFGWSVGLGRSFTRWAYLRADYRRERRRSNLPAFRVTTDALVLQLGIGYLGNAQP